MVNYAKLKEDGSLEYIPNVIEVEGTTYFKFDGPFPEDIANKAGYKLIVDTPYPQDGKSYNSHWEEQGNHIVKVWVEYIPPEPEPLTPPQERQRAYETLPIIEYGNGIITVDEAEKLCINYMFEQTVEAQDTVNELKIKITNAKAQIREMYPDVVKEGGEE